MRFNRLLASAAVAALMMGAAGTAQAQNLPVDISTTVTLTSDYLFRGISQTDGKPAAQAGVTASHESGFFAGIWGSNVDFGPGSDADYEVDLFAGFANSIGDFGYSVQALYYMYPSDNADANYLELGVDLSYTLAYSTFNVSGYWSPDYAGDAGDAWYLAYGVDIALSDAWTFSVATGWNGFENDRNYLNSTIGLAYEVDGWVFDATYSLTDLQGEGVPNKFVVSVSKTF